MNLAAVVALVLFLAACGGVKPPESPPSQAQQIAVSPTDTATVRRLCTAPDSVLARRAPCVLRGDFVGVRKF